MQELSGEEVETMNERALAQRRSLKRPQSSSDKGINADGWLDKPFDSFLKYAKLPERLRRI
eukprot:scaffold610_cov95-Pinguiococcus_pyrenoidosus.AAC.1